QLYDLCWARREPGAANASTRNVSKFSCYLALRSQQLTTRRIANDARNCAQRHRRVVFAAEGLRLVLCFAFNLRNSGLISRYHHFFHDRGQDKISRVQNPTVGNESRRDNRVCFEFLQLSDEYS